MLSKRFTAFLTIISVLTAALQIGAAAAPTARANCMKASVSMPVCSISAAMKSKPLAARMLPAEATGTR